MWFPADARLEIVLPARGNLFLLRDAVPRGAFCLVVDMATFPGEVRAWCRNYGRAAECVDQRAGNNPACPYWCIQMIGS